MTTTARFVHAGELLVMLLGLASCATAYAQEGTPARAEQTQRADALFREGKELMVGGDLVTACSRLQDSYRLDPATGALLALALCHEQLGKLATAQHQYLEAAARSRSEQNYDREHAAQERAAALQTALSTLIIDMPERVQGVVVTLDGVLVQQELLGTAIPVDGGMHRVQARARNRQPWQKTVRLASSADSMRIVIPVLRDSTASSELAAQSEASYVDAVGYAPVSHERKRSRGWSTEEWLGAGLMAAGAVGLGVGTVFAVQAESDPPLTAQYCMSHACDAATSADKAAAAFVIGGVVAATGAVIYLTTGHPSSQSDSAHRRPSLRGQAWVVPGGGGAAVSGQF